MNRSSVPDAMGEDNPVPAPIKRKKVGEDPEEQGYGPLRGGRQLVNAIGLDGETVKYVIGSVAAAGSSAGSAAGSAIASGATQYAQFVRDEGIYNLAHTVKETARLTAVGTGAVLNVAAGTARTAASGTGAVLNFAADRLLPAALTEDEYRQMVAHEARVAEDRAYMTAQARLHQRALVAQEKSRIAEQEAAQREELVFQDARSVASSLVRAKHGPGRRGNVTRALQGQGRQRPAREQLVRNEPEGIGKKTGQGCGAGCD